MSLDEAKELELQTRCCASTAAELANSSVCNSKSLEARACARSFRRLSKLEHVNPELRVNRSSMTAQRMSGLNVHRDLPIDIAAAVDEFSRRHPRW